MARILIIEDNHDNLTLMTYLLEAFGHEVCSARDGLSGLELAHRESVDLIVCDVNLPKADGYEIARRLKLDPAFHTPLIAVTALAMVGDRDKVLAAGFDNYISKPIEPTTFVGQIEASLKGGSGTSSPTVPEPAATPAAAAAAPAALGGARVLVVDDSPVNHQLTRALLEPFGYRISFAASTETALTWLDGGTVDLIISDLHMPDGDGMALLERIRGESRWQQLPFMLISSSAQGDVDARRAHELGADCFLLRPIEPEQVLAAVKRCIEGDSQHG